MGLFSKTENLSAEEKLKNRLNNMDQKVVEIERVVAKQRDTVEILETALKRIIEEGGSAALCPSCEAAKVVDGDYLCKDCRYGG